MRGKDYALLDLPQVQARLALPPEKPPTHPETGTCRALFDCPDLPLSPTGPRIRVIVATHPVSTTEAKIGTTRGEVVYELFYTALPQGAFTPADVVALYLHRGAFETVLGDEDQEQDPDRWCSHTACGQEFWQILSQWVWNLRLELGHILHPTPMRTTVFASAARAPEPASRPPLASVPRYGPPTYASTWKRDHLEGQDFVPQPDGTLRCPADHPLYPQERRPERDGTVRVVYAARIGDCRPCPLRERWKFHGTSTQHPRRVSAVLHPLIEPLPLEEPPQAPLATHPILWGDWERRFHRREWVKLLRTQRVDIRLPTTSPPAQPPPPQALSRAQRAHYRLSWAKPLARNAIPSASPCISVTLFGVPHAFAASLGLLAL
jgi:hypothetical protein